VIRRPTRPRSGEALGHAGGTRLPAALRGVDGATSSETGYPQEICILATTADEILGPTDDSRLSNLYPLRRDLGRIMSVTGVLRAGVARLGAPQSTVPHASGRGAPSTASAKRTVTCAKQLGTPPHASMAGPRAVGADLASSRPALGPPAPARPCIAPRVCRGRRCPPRTLRPWRASPPPALCVG
jgi:hypothetical protein